MFAPRIKSVVLIRHAHSRCRPDQVERRSVQSYMQHGGLNVTYRSVSGADLVAMQPFWPKRPRAGAVSC